jgi:energy-coupling factor transporter ATP-binding protein EcfA2
MAGLMIEKKLLQQRIENTLSIFSTLTHLLQRTPLKLSGGERQLLTLAMATLHEPKLILIDEPFTGLSPQNLNLVASNLKNLNNENGITLLIVEHRVKETIRIADRIISMKLGKIFNSTEVKENFNINELKYVFV